MATSVRDHSDFVNIRVLGFGGVSSTKTECDYLNGWIKKGHVRKNLTRNGEPQRYSWGTQKCWRGLGVGWGGEGWGEGGGEQLMSSEMAGEYQEQDSCRFLGS